MPFIWTAALTVAMMILPCAGAHAIDQPIPARKVLLRDTGSRNLFVFVARGPGISPPPESPALVGATLEIINPVTGESTALSMPNTHWRANRAGTVLLYVDRKFESGPVRSARLKAGALRIKGATTGITLNEPAQGKLLVRLTIGTTRYCALADGSSIRRDEPCKFIAAGTTAPPSCALGAPSS